MNYVILAAGMGTRLHPFTKTLPKCMLQIGYGETVIHRMVRLIQTFDPSSSISIVTGFMHNEIEASIVDCEFVYNPFFSVTNSIASLWFARHVLDDEVTIINGDIVVSEKLFTTITELRGKDLVLLDSSIKKNGDYNVQVADCHVVVMSKQLTTYHGEYAGITKLTKDSASLVKQEICRMIENNGFNEWYENVLVQMILNTEFRLEYFDIAEHDWAEIDSVDHLLLARKIQGSDRKNTL